MLYIGDPVKNLPERELLAVTEHERGHLKTLSGDKNNKYAKLSSDTFAEMNGTKKDDSVKNDKSVEPIINKLQDELDKFIKVQKEKGNKISNHLKISELVADSISVGGGKTTVSAATDMFKRNIKKIEKEINERKNENTRNGTNDKYDSVLQDLQSQLEELKFRIYCLNSVKDKLK